MAKYIAAVSGGPDSMAMLHMYRKQIVAVCHVNYQKRLSAIRDMNIVNVFCNQLEIPFEKIIVDKKMYEKYYKKNHNFQTIARRIRYDFFIKCAAKYKTNTVLIAHTKDDFLETAYMQRKRQSKTLFLGIDKKIKYQNIYIFRPLLDMWKVEILQYCRDNQIPYGLDETNELDIYERNRIRKALSSLTIGEKEKEAKKINDFNTHQLIKIQQVNNKYITWELNSFNLDIYRKAPVWMKEQLVYHFLQNHHIGRITKDKIKLLNQFLMSKKSKVNLRLATDVFLRKIDNILILKYKDKIENK